jgi:hypothetical protein
MTGAFLRSQGDSRHPENAPNDLISRNERHYLPLCSDSSQNQSVVDRAAKVLTLDVTNLVGSCCHLYSKSTESRPLR